jgi:hypothetical protein
MPTLTYLGKSFKVTYRPFPQSDVTATQTMLGMDADEVRKRFEARYSGEIVSVEEENS